MEVPGSLYLDCPKCGEETLHSVLKGRTGKRSTLSATVKCSECDDVRKEVIKAEKKILLKVIVSHRENSIKDKVEFLHDEVLHVGDIFLYDDYDVKVTGIETEKARVGAAGVIKIKTLWVIRFDFVDVPVSIKEGETTKSFKIQCDPNDDFNVGEEMFIKDVRYIIDKIRIIGLTVLKPDRGAFAYDIKRIYLKNPPIKQQRRPGRGRYKR